MSWKKNLLAILFCCLIFNQGFADRKVSHPKYYRSNISTRFLKAVPENLIHGAQNLGNDQITAGAQLPDTLKVLALRVQFQKDNDRTTTGDGWFELTTPDSIMINPPPHDYNYFANQLKALKNYFEKVSKGKLILQISDNAGNYFVFPQQPDSAWTLDKSMNYYNPNTTEAQLDQGLAELFRDAIQIADVNSNIDFSQYDVFLVFHAGVGWEFTQDFDTTPSDIPSVFLGLNDLKNNIGGGDSDYMGIAVDNGKFFVTEGLILPETENQGGYEFGLLGTMTIMFGHQLGLPNLFDTDTGRPGIGIFGLMDQGSGSYSGLIPVEPCAWSKIFLGWAEPILATAGNDLPVACSLTANPNKIYKIPINAKEYFLIENRQRAVLKSRSVAFGYDEYGTKIEFNDDGEIALPANLTKLGVIVDIDEHDYGLPGSGILIWHIDENIIEQHYTDNRINVDMEHRGVDLVEADGAQDIGYFFNFFGITGFESGGAYDMWWDNNEDHLYANSSETVMFTPETMPNSNAFSHANSGIYITNFSTRDSVMYFTLEVKQFQPGFPVTLGEQSGKSPMVSGDLNNDGKRELVAATADGKILAWKFNGEKFITNDAQTFQINVKGDTTYMPLAVFASMANEKFEFAPSLADLNTDGKLEIIAAGQNNRLYAWQPTDANLDGEADLLFFVELQSAANTVPVIGDFHQGADAQLDIVVGLKNGNVACISQSGSTVYNTSAANAAINGVVGYEPGIGSGVVVVSADGKIVRLDNDGQIEWSATLETGAALNPPALADVNKDYEMEIVVSSAAGHLYILNTRGELLPGYRTVSTNVPLSAPVIADVDYNGYPDVVLTGGGKIFAYQFTGIPVTNFPMRYENSQTNVPSGDPVIADLDGDHFPEIFVSNLSNQILIFDKNGKKDLSFPISVSGNSVAAIGLQDLDGNQKLNLYARSSDHYGYVWNLNFDYSPTNLVWGEYLNDASHNAVFRGEHISVSSQGVLMPEKTVYNYPNPTEGNSTAIRYFLRAEAKVTVRIYDMAGELIEQLAGSGFPELDNEISWDISNVQSGVYLARVKAETATESNTTIIKIAVVK